MPESGSELNSETGSQEGTLADSLKQVLRLFPVPAFSIDPTSDNFRTWNVAAQRAFGWREEEVLDVHFEDIISRDSEGETIARRIVNGRELSGLQASLRPKETRRSASNSRPLRFVVPGGQRSSL